MKRAMSNKLPVRVNHYLAGSIWQLKNKFSKYE